MILSIASETFAVVNDFFAIGAIVFALGIAIGLKVLSKIF